MTLFSQFHYTKQTKIIFIERIQEQHSSKHHFSTEFLCFILLYLHGYQPIRWIQTHRPPVLS